MGSFDGAEICELIGLFDLHKLNEKFEHGNIGLYRDDGLAVFENLSGGAADKARKEFTRIFGDLGLKITIQSNVKVADFLDVTLNLSNGKFYPFSKPNNEPVYINAKSNHPPTIIKHLPAAINRRISNLSCNEEEFHKASGPYNAALRASGYTTNLRYEQQGGKSNSNKKKKRTRKIIWFNPPFSQNVMTNVAKTFLQLVNKHFTSNHALHKIFNRNTLKTSYSCMPNIANIIKAHNQKTLSQPTESNQTRSCNCRKPEMCPLDGQCLTDNLVYKATVKADNRPEKIYIGMTENTFKTRFNGHKVSLKHKSHRNDTTLSKYIWKLKDNGTNFNIHWSIVKRAKAYKGSTRRCNLCLTEKLCILSAPKDTLLNKRSELVSKCRHENKFCATNQKKTP